MKQAASVKTACKNKSLVSHALRCVSILILHSLLTGCPEPEIEEVSPYKPLPDIPVSGGKTREEIAIAWELYKPVNIEGSVYSSAPRVDSNYEPGALVPDFIDNGGKTLRFARYLAGLTNSVQLDASCSSSAQHGAVLLAAMDVLSANPSPKPANMETVFYQVALNAAGQSNLFCGTGTDSSISDAVKFWLNDSGADNIENLGHRRWLLHPKMQKTGFGCADSVLTSKRYIVMPVLDASSTEDDPLYTAWPSRGYFPAGFFGRTQAWSVSLSANGYSRAICAPLVKLSCINTGQIWNFSNEDTDASGKYFNIEQSDYGTNYCIIFRPDNVPPLSTAKKWHVEITGLKNAVGEDTGLDYVVEFFDLE